VASASRCSGLGRVEIMTMLLDAGADINAVDENRIHCVSCCNFRDEQFDALKLLVERGANLGVVDSMATHCSRLSHNMTE
jgi:hypothetical protein